MFFNDRIKLAQFWAAKSARFGELDRIQPEFCVTFRLFHVDVTRFVPFATEEEKPITSDAKNSGIHANFIRAIYAITRISAFANRRYRIAGESGPDWRLAVAALKR
jgi:hypothetical protein